MVLSSYFYSSRHYLTPKIFYCFFYQYSNFSNSFRFFFTFLHSSLAPILVLPANVFVQIASQIIFFSKSRVSNSFRVICSCKTFLFSSQSFLCFFCSQRLPPPESFFASYVLFFLQS